MPVRTFRARLEAVGSRGRTVEQTADKCKKLMKDVLDHYKENHRAKPTMTTKDQIYYVIEKFFERPNTGSVRIVSYGPEFRQLREAICFDSPRPMCTGEVLLKFEAWVDAHVSRLPDPRVVAQSPRLVAQSPDRQCVICLTNEKTHAFMPCGHLCVCEVCGKRAFQERHACPVCRAGATECRVIYS